MNDDQNVKKVINNNLAFFDEKFGGWSGLVRKTAAKYGFPDPLVYMLNPLRPDRWRSNCRMEIVKFWDEKIRKKVQYSKEGVLKSSSILIDSESLSTTHAMRKWKNCSLLCVFADPLLWVAMNYHRRCNHN